MNTIKFVKESIKEVKYLKKPTKKELLKNTLIVCVFCLVSSGVIWLMDTSIQAVLKLIFK